MTKMKQWLLSKDVTESTYHSLADSGFHEAKFFVMLQPEDIVKVGIKPLAQEVLVRNLVLRFQSGARGGAEAANVGLNVGGKKPSIIRCVSFFFSFFF
jgi:hypothetical protein